MLLTDDILAAEVSASSLLRYAGNVSASFRCCQPQRKTEKVTASFPLNGHQLRYLFSFSNSCHVFYCPSFSSKFAAFFGNFSCLVLRGECTELNCTEMNM